MPGVATSIFTRSEASWYAPRSDPAEWHFTDNPCASESSALSGARTPAVEEAANCEWMLVLTVLLHTDVASGLCFA